MELSLQCKKTYYLSYFWPLCWSRFPRFCLCCCCCWLSVTSQPLCSLHLASFSFSSRHRSQGASSEGRRPRSRWRRVTNCFRHMSAETKLILICFESMLTWNGNFEISGLRFKVRNIEMSQFIWSLLAYYWFNHIKSMLSFSKDLTRISFEHNLTYLYITFQQWKYIFSI